MGKMRLSEAFLDPFSVTSPDHALYKNSASVRAPALPRTPQLGVFVRVAQWNIERGIEFEAIKAALTDAAHFAKLIDPAAYPRTSKDRKEILHQVASMKQADVIVLNEVDWGMKRTEYRNVVAELAAALRMNYAYGVEFVEVDPIALGIEEFEELSPEDKAQRFSVAFLWRMCGYNRSRISRQDELAADFRG